MKPSAMKPNETGDELFIYSGKPYNAIGKLEAEILNLTVMMKKGVPVVSFVAVWDEGGHYGSGETEKEFPYDVYRRLSPDAIVNWLKELFPPQHVNIDDWESIRHNPKLKVWCEKHKPEQA